MSGETHGDEGRIERFARKNIKKSILFMGALAVTSILLPPAGAAVATTLAAGSGVEAIGSKMVQEHMKQRRLKKG